MKLTTQVVFHHAILLFLALILSATHSTAQNNPAPTPARITQAVDENNLVALRGNVHPLARAEFDRGPAPSDLALNRMLLVLSRSPEQAGSLQALLDQQQDRSSPQYRRWLTPQQFGQQFGPSDSDIAQITSWLQIHGFHDVHVSNGRVTIEFSGTAAQVQEAFRASIHRYVVNGAEHWANANDPQIPSALAPVVAGVFTLHNFLKAPQSQAAPQAFPARVTAGKRPQFTGSNGFHALAPADFYTIYNFNAFQAAPPFGSSASVAIVARTNINVGDVENFLQYTLNGGAVPQVLVNGADPGDLGGGEEVEAVLDASWVAAASPFASITLVVSQSTATTDGVDLSENYIIDNNLADVMSESFSGCEASFTSAEATAASNLAQQAAAEGITYVVSSGDSGAEGCDDPNSETLATGPLSVNLLASNPYVLAVGGTIFNEGSIPSNYWSATNNSIPLRSAISYIPENVWNESCKSGQPNCSKPSIWAGGGGASTFFTKPSWQTGVTGIPADNARDLPDVSLTAAGHDPYLICLDGSCVPDANGFITFYGVSGTSASTQAFAGIMANVAFKAGVRLGQPNYVLYRLANAENLSQCNASNTTTLPASTCVFNDVTVGNNAVPGESNYGTPSAKYQSGVGYDLATGLGSVNITNLINQWNSVAFNATSTTFSVSPTTATHGDPINISGAVAPTSGSGTPTGVVWLTQNGYFHGNLTGDGTVDIFKLDGTGSYSSVTHLLPGGSYQVNAYYPGDGTFGGSSSPTPVQVTISPEPTTLSFSVLTKDASGNLVPFTSGPYGTPIYFQAQVNCQSGYGSPTGTIFYNNGNSFLWQGGLTSTSNGKSLSSADIFNPVGVYSVTASYFGDNSFAPSNDNTPVSFSITSNSTQTSLVTEQTLLGLTLTATVSASGVGSAPSGVVSFTNGVGGPVLGTESLSGEAPSGGTVQAVANFNASPLAPGQYNFVASYPGDRNYGASSSATVPMTLTADFTLGSQGLTSQTVTPGQTATYLNGIVITPEFGYSSTVNFSCGVPAAGATCSVTPASYATANGVGFGSVTVTTKGLAASIPQPKADPSGPPPFHLPAARLGLLALLLCSILILLTRTRRRRFAMPLALLLLTAAIAPVGCGGGNSGTAPSSNQKGGTPAGNYTVTVTATAGSTTHTTTLTLIVQ
jgi:hypothetical protein